jgi:RNA polymerase sigma-70 factor (ECF subfamily)
MAPATMSPPIEIPEEAAEPETSDETSALWLRRLRSSGAAHDAAVSELHDLLVGAARFEVERRRAGLPHLRGGDHDDIVHESADDALLALLGKLDDFRGDSRFTTWAYKFALLEAGVKIRRRAWQGREIPIAAEGWAVLADLGRSAEDRTEDAELFDALSEEIRRCLSDRQREVLVAITLNDVPIDVLAERLGSTRGAIYKTLHDARRKLREALGSRGLGPGQEEAR